MNGTRRAATQSPPATSWSHAAANPEASPYPFHRDPWPRKAVVVAVLIVPLLATVWGVGTLFLGRGPTLLDLLLLLGMWAFTGTGISVGFHRLLTHRAIAARAPTRFLLLVAGSMALQGPAADWAATHLRHHSRSDQAGDPHSPRDGFWHAHCLWLLRDRFVRSGPAHDRLLRDPVTRFVTRTWIVWAALGLAAPFFIAFSVTGSLAGAFGGLLWGGLVRVFVGHHITWSVNSLGHRFGTHPFVTKDRSTNNWLVAVLGWGEGWHNNHHAFPRAAYIGMRWWQVDLGAWLIVALRGLGQVTHVSQPTRMERLRRLRTASAKPGS